MSHPDHLEIAIAEASDTAGAELVRACRAGDNSRDHVHDLLTGLLEEEFWSPDTRDYYDVPDWAIEQALAVTEATFDDEIESVRFEMNELRRVLRRLQKRHQEVIETRMAARIADDER